MTYKKRQNFSFQKFKLIIFVLSFFIICTSFAQERVLFRKFINSSTPVTQKIATADSLIKLYETKNIDSLNFIYYLYAYWAYDYKPIEEVITLQEKAFYLSEKNSPDDTFAIQLNARDLAYYYAENNQSNKSIKTHHKLIAANNNNNFSARSYLELANVYFRLEDYNKAYELYEIAITQLIKHNLDRSLLRNAYQDLTRVCYFLTTKESLKNGNKFGKSADSLANIIETPLTEKFLIKRNLGLIYKEGENLDFNKAFRYFNEALVIAEQANDSLNIAITYQALGNLHNIFNKEKSIKFYNTAINYINKNDTLFLGDLYYGLGHTYSIWSDFKISLEYRHKGLQLFTGNNFIQTKSIDADFLINFKENTPLLVHLTQLAQTYLNYYKIKQDPILLEKAIAYFKMCDVLIDNLRINSSGYKSRLYWRELSTDIYGKAIKACYLSNNMEDAFYFMEKNKALLLLEDMNSKSFKRGVQLPPEIQEKYNALKKDMAITNNQLVDENKWSKTKTDSLKKQRIDLDIELSVLEHEHDITYKTLDVETAILSVKEVQNNLKDDEVVVEYHISIDNGYGILTNKDYGYALFITKNDTHLFEINNLTQFENEVTTLINAFKTPFKTQDDIDKFNTLSHTVYNTLFPSKEIKDLIKGKTLSIAPDSYLSLLPFEALSTSSDSTSYLIRDAEIHYIYSNSFLKNIESPTASNSKSLAIAPVTFKNETLTPLNNSLTEVNYIQDYYSGDTLLNEQASKANFLNALNTTSNGIIHIASHANAQDKVAPWIAFNDESITLEELYLTQNDASLVVLSGCNTSVGEQETGEGVMSLARGFFYSGSQSVISSLWSIDDRSTSDIVNAFYKNLSKGQTKSKALHNAKLAYLDNHNLSEVSPHFWASLILLGQNDTLQPAQSYWMLYLSGLLLLMLVLFFRFKNKNNTN